MKTSAIKTRAGPAGVQFFNRNTGITVLVDEARVPSNQWSRAPRHVSIALTSACDMHCTHCFVKRTDVSLSADVVTQWLQTLDLNGCLSIGFGGGEPTLHPDFAELCRFAAQKTNLGVTCTTHGHHFDDGLISSIAGSLNFVRISMDGVGATYESIRQKSFESLLAQMEKIGGVFPFGVNYLVNSRTLSDLEQAVVLAADLGASQFLLLPEQPVNGHGGIDDATTLALCDWVKTYEGVVPLAVSEFGAAGLPTVNPLSQEAGLRAYAHVDANGTLKTSSFDNEGVTIGPGGVMSALADLSRDKRRGL